MKKIHKVLIMLLLLVVVSGSIYVFFKSFKLIPLTGYATEILAAFLGATFTTVITAILLFSQSAAEEQKEKSLGIFHTKLSLYNEFIDFLNKVIEDGKINSKEMLELRKWATKFALVSGGLFYQTLQEFMYQVAHYGVFRYEDLTKKNKSDYKNYLVETGEISEDLSEEEIEEKMDFEFTSIGYLISFMSFDLGEADNGKFELLEGRAQILDEIFTYK